MELEGPVYFDTNVFIYSIEGHEDYVSVLSEIFGQIFNQGLAVVTSELTLAECLVKPAKDKNQSAITQYENHIKTNAVLTVLPVTRDILRDSAHVRSELSLKLPDAIHIATAIARECKTFVTNDKKLRVPVGMRRVYLKDPLHAD